jgi:beta-aspartyl-peptidase (threonine type)
MGLALTSLFFEKRFVMFREKKWSIIVHGGARLILPYKIAETREALLWAMEQGVHILRDGGKALDAAEQAVRTMEESCTFNAGSGARPRSHGIAEMDASVMEGRKLGIGAVAGISDVKHPISVARALLNESPVLIIGDHAREFARKKGFEKPSIKTPVSAEEAKEDTVGCVAYDIEGNIVTCISTGGSSGSIPGRVGDAVLPGCGFYADNERGGVCLTGKGEYTARTILAAEIIHEMQTLEVNEALKKGFLNLKKVKGSGGCIAIDRHGTPAWYHTSIHLPVAFQASNSDMPSVFLRKKEEKKK